MGNLLEHAERELRLAGLFDADSDYDGHLGVAALELLELFGKQGHSGSSASMVRELFIKLSMYQNLTPLTSNPEEWEDIAEHMGRPMWHSKRNPVCFSEDGGKTWWNVNDKVAEEDAPSTTLNKQA